MRIEVVGEPQLGQGGGPGEVWILWTLRVEWREKLLGRIFIISLSVSWRTHLNFPSNNAVPSVPPPYPVLMLHVMAAMKPTVNRLLSSVRAGSGGNMRPPRLTLRTRGSFCSDEGGSDPNIGSGESLLFLGTTQCSAQLHTWQELFLTHSAHFSVRNKCSILLLKVQDESPDGFNSIMRLPLLRS